MTLPAEDDAFPPLCFEYLTMFGNPTPEMSVNAAPRSPNSSEEWPAQAILGLFRAGKSNHATPLAHLKSLTDCGCPLGDHTVKESEFLTSRRSIRQDPVIPVASPLPLPSPSKLALNHYLTTPSHAFRNVWVSITRSSLMTASPASMDCRR